MNAEQRLTDLEAALAEYIRQNALAQERSETEFKRFREEMLAFKNEIREDTRRLKEEMTAFKNEIREDTRRLKEEMAAFKNEMLVFKDEMREFKNEMLVFKDEMREFKNEMLVFKDEMREFKNEMTTFKDRVEQSIRENNKQWGALANKMGTLVEDIIFPAARPVIQSVFGVEVKQIAMRVMRQKEREREEFDVVAVSETRVFLIEVKSSPRLDDLKDFQERKSQAFLRLFPEYQSLKLVLIMASLSFPDDALRQATERGIFAMAYREWEYMDILNAKDLLPSS